MAEVNRAKKSGLGAEAERKLETGYDQADADGTTNAVMIWINATLQGEHEPIPNSSQRDLHRCLANGVMLCKVINKLLASEQKKQISFQSKANSPFVAMGNIEHYNKACVEFGMKKEDLFQSTDLWEGRKGPFLNIINGIHRLACLANEKGFQVFYTGNQTKFLDNE